MMLRSCLVIFVIAIIILPIFSTAAAVPERSFNCYKYEKNFPDLNLVDLPAEEKEIVKCDQCFGYLCYANDQYILGYGCRDDYFKSCSVNIEDQKHVLNGNNKNGCANPDDFPLFDMCVKDYCSHNRMDICIKKTEKKHPNSKIGPKYTYADITFTQLTTPAPTTTTTTTTTQIPTTTKSAFNLAGQNDENNPQNGGNGSQSGSQNEISAASNNSVNFKMFLFTFFGIFLVIYFM